MGRWHGEAMSPAGTSNKTNCWSDLEMEGRATVMAFTTLRVSARFLQSPFLPRDTLVQREKAVPLSLLGSLVKLSIKGLNTSGQEALQNKSQQDSDTPPLLWHEYKSSNSRKARRCRHSGQ